MGDGVDGRVTALQDFGVAVRRTMAGIAAPGASQEALHYVAPAIPAETLVEVANEFGNSLLTSTTSVEHWDTAFRGTGDFYAAFATLLGANMSEVDKAHGQALQDLYQQIGTQIPSRAG